MGEFPIGMDDVYSQIANGSKHVRGRQTFDTMRVAAAPFSFDTVHAGFDQRAWDGPVRYVQGSLPVGRDGKGYLLIDFGEDALNAGTCWRSLFASGVTSSVCTSHTGDPGEQISC